MDKFTLFKLPIKYVFNFLAYLKKVLENLIIVHGNKKNDEKISQNGQEINRINFLNMRTQ